MFLCKNKENNPHVMSATLLICATGNTTKLVGSPMEPQKLASWDTKSDFFVHVYWCCISIQGTKIKYADDPLLHKLIQIELSFQPL